MARKICFALAILIAFIGLARPVVAQGDPCADNPNGLKITLPGGQVINSTVIDAVIEIDGKQQPVQLTISCLPTGSSAAGATQASGAPPANATTGGAAPTEAPAAAPAALPSAESQGQTNTIVLVVVAALVPVLLIGIGILVYLKVFRPRAQQKPYNEALKSIKQGNYKEALPALTAVEGKLSEADRRTARFFIAYSNYEQNNIDEAIYLLNVLYGENSQDEEVAYFLAYLHAKQKQYDKAEPILEKLEKAGKLGMYQARKLLGMVKLYQGMKAFNSGRIDVAVDLFEKVRALGDYADQIPGDMSNRHMVLGTKALYEHNLDEARHQFEALKTAAAKAPAAEQTGLKASATLGMAMVAWLSDSVNYDDVEKQLVHATQVLDPDAPVTRPWPKEGLQFKSFKDKVDDPKATPTPTDDSALVLRDIHFLRGINMLKKWNSMDRAKPEEVDNAMFVVVLERFACALAYDDDFSDVLLIVGLLFYYLYEPGSKNRAEGIRCLEEARKQGMRVPEALEILNHIDRIRRDKAGVVEQYLAFLDTYVHDQRVPKELRLEVLKSLPYNQKIQGWTTSPDIVQARQVEPTVAEVHHRSEILREHVEEILKTSSKRKELETVQKLSKDLDEGGKKLLDQAKEVQQTEAELMKETGNQLLKD